MYEIVSHGFRSCYPLLSPSSFYSSEVKVYTGKDLPPVVALGQGAQAETVTPGPQTRPSKPSAVIQQVVMKAMVHPYRKEEANLVMTDAFRGPLASAFKLHIEDIMLFVDPKRSVSNFTNLIRLHSHGLLGYIQRQDDGLVMLEGGRPVGQIQVRLHPQRRPRVRLPHSLPRQPVGPRPRRIPGLLVSHNFHVQMMQCSRVQVIPA